MTRFEDDQRPSSSSDQAAGGTPHPPEDHRDRGSLPRGTPPRSGRAFSVASGVEWVVEHGPEVRSGSVGRVLSTGEKFVLCEGEKFVLCGCARGPMGWQRWCDEHRPEGAA